MDAGNAEQPTPSARPRKNGVWPTSGTHAPRRSATPVVYQVAFGDTNNNVATQPQRNLSPNYIKTTKYTLLTFLPINLFSQFRRLYNVYFLLGAIFSLADVADSPISPLAQVSPLIIVLSISAIKDAVEDYGRFQADKVANTAPATVIRAGETQTIRSMDLMPGDLVYLTKGQKVHADLVLLSTSVDDGTCYIETSELDGETALKRRSGLQSLTHANTPMAISKLCGRIRCEPPNENLNRFEGTLMCSDNHEKTESTEKQKEHSLNLDQFLPRGTFLHNTDFAFGVCVYAGVDTKIFRNLKNGGLKYSSLERKLNRLVIYAFVYNAFILVLTIVMEYQNNYKKFWYLRSSSESIDDAKTAQTYFTSFMVSFIVFSYTIPVSVFVMMEVVRVIQRQFMIWDDKMQSPDGVHMKVNNSNLNEDLGAVKYVFSDKTGTLTRNQMTLDKLFIGNTLYDEGTDPGCLKRAYLSPDTSLSQREAIKMLVLNIVVCNGVVPSLEASAPLQDIVYESQSPDENALLNGLKISNIFLKARRKESLTAFIFGEEVTYDLLVSLEFNSDRKRMSVIVRQGDDIMVFTKGADNIIACRLCSDESAEKIDITKTRLNNFSEAGLRTLMFASKKITNAEYDKFREIYDEAQNSFDNREQRVGVVCDLFEKEFHLIGVSAVEDQLQDQVPETIDFLLKSNIRLWLLTGDKQETAINIGYSSKLLNQHMTVLCLSGVTLSEILYELDNFLEISSKPNRGSEFALIVPGEALELIFRHLAFKFLQLGMRCRSVICCRVTPLQKALVVRLVKKELRVITLSIGDGANDVSMIQEADIGVGIQGFEGAQAVRASDYAFVEFKCLARLLSLHGRYSYLRLTKLILYGFYKNIVLISIQFLFGIYNLWSCSTIYNGSFLTAWNILFTFAPSLVMGCMEKDVSEAALSRYPQMYKAVANGLYWNVRGHLTWISYMLWDTAVCYLVGFYIWNTTSVHSENGHESLFDCVQWLFAIIVLNVATSKLALEIRHWVWLTWASFALSYILYILTFGGLEVLTIIRPYISSTLPSDDLPDDIITIVHSDATYYLAGILAPAISILPHLAISYYCAQNYPNDIDLISEITRQQELKEQSEETPKQEVTSFTNNQTGEQAQLRGVRANQTLSIINEYTEPTRSPAMIS